MASDISYDKLTSKKRIENKNALVNDLFETEHLKSNLKENTIKGGFITIVSQAAKFSLNTFSTMILARLLTPRDFGLIAMVSVFTGFVGLFTNLGLSMATVQCEEVNHEQVSTLFWLNFGLSIIISVICIMLSPFIAWFYNEKKLLMVTVVISITFIFSGLSAQHNALLRRQMRFNSLACIDLLSLFFGITCAIIMAHFKAGYWALVGLTVIQGLTSMLMNWFYLSWIPGLPKKNIGLRPMLSFGKNLTCYNLMNYFSRNADNFIIGKWIGSNSLGIYTKAYNLLLLPIQQIAGPLGNIAIPALSRVNDDPERYRRVFYQFQSKLCIITVPLMTFLLIGADSIIVLVLGKQWSSAISVFRWLGLVGISQAILISSGWYFISQARSNEIVQWGIVGSTVCIISFIIGLPWGINGIAASYGAFGLFLRTPYTFWWLTRKGHIQSRFYLSSIWPGIKMSVVLAVVCILIKVLFNFSEPIINFTSITFGAIFSCFLSSFVFKDVRELLLELISLSKLYVNKIYKERDL